MENKELKKAKAKQDIDASDIFVVATRNGIHLAGDKAQVPALLAWACITYCENNEVDPLEFCDKMKKVLKELDK